MPHVSQPLQNFNLDTMSGVYPGTRTAIYQRLRLEPEAPGEPPLWTTLLWYTDPPSAALYRRESRPGEGPLLRLDSPLQPPGVQWRLQAGLAPQGWRVATCGLCRYWQPTSLATEDGLTLGRCRWSPLPDEPATPDELALQSCLALRCDHFARQDEPPPPPETGAAQPAAPRVPKAAELDIDRLPFWPRWWARWRRRFQRPSAPATAPPLLERSGVGAGTEPCFVCQGRLANLGALAVASPEGDKQTLSVWRCRLCQTTYFNDWIDRWERLESLETEERYFRISPSEADHALPLIHSEPGGDHPAGRAARDHLRSRLLALVAGREPLSHQVRQGR